MPSKDEVAAAMISDPQWMQTVPWKNCAHLKERKRKARSEGSKVEPRNLSREDASLELETRIIKATSETHRVNLRMESVPSGEQLAAGADIANPESGC